jgi:DNA-binding LytR/AlgR family response regulator
MGARSTLRALVVEDEWPARNYLVELLESSRMAEVVGAVGGLEEARQVLSSDVPSLGIDVVFIDIALGGTENGLALVREARSASSPPMFVLATAYDRHAMEAFELGVADYLLKPFSEERVHQCMRRLLERRGVTVAPPSSAPPRIVARRKRGLVFLEAHEIWAFEAADRLTFVHSQSGVFDIDLSLAAVEASFGRAFLRVHRNWLVSAAHIKELERDGHETKLFVGTGVADAGKGVRVPVARERSAAVREMLLENATGLRRP